MRKIVFVVFGVLVIVLHANAQVPSRTSAARHDTTAKVKNADNDTVEFEQDTLLEDESVQIEPKKYIIQKSRSNTLRKNDCKECEEKLQKMEEEKTQLEGKLSDLNELIGDAKAINDIDNRDFYRNLITAPLAKKYDSIQVDCYLKTASLFDHESKEEMKWVYEVYYPLLENYGQYNSDVATLIEKVIKSFELVDLPVRDIEMELFKADLEKSEYYKKYRYKRNISQEIKYLEEVIAETMALFQQNDSFTKENFEAQLEKLR